MLNFKTTEEIKIPEKLIDQIIGQNHAVEIIKKAASQGRNVLLIGEPGTGKTLLAQAMAELLPIKDLEDVLIYKNLNDENTPLVKVVKTYPNGKPSGENMEGQGRQIIKKEKMNNMMNMGKGNSIIAPIIMILVIALVVISMSGIIKGYNLIVIAALILGILIFGSVLLFTSTLAKRVGLPGMETQSESKLVVDNTGKSHAPFLDATGNKAGALFGDVRHDPFQSGGLGTPAHLRVESGAIHKSNKGVLYIDEISNLEPRAQQELLTAMQEKKYPITGQSDMSSGAMVKTEPVPCDFLLVAAGNLPDIQKMHPALRSRIRGYGYEIAVDSTIPDNEHNRDLLVRFIAQEVRKDGRIPHFSKEGVMEIIKEAQRRSGRKNSLSLVLRDLGGLVRAAGDISVENNKKLVGAQEVLLAKELAKPIEAQIITKQVEFKKEYKVFDTKGYKVGMVNGLAVLGSSVMMSGIIIPIASEVTPASSRSEGKFIPTGKLGKIASEAVKNVSAVIKKEMKKDVANYDIHVQFLQTYEGIEGDSASISVAIAVISAMEDIPVDQSVAMTGSMSVRGDVLPVGGVTNKVEAAIEAGIKKVIVPYSNLGDINIDKEKLKKIKIIAAKDIYDVIKEALKPTKARDELLKRLKK